MLIDDKTKEILKDKFERELQEIVDIKGDMGTKVIWGWGMTPVK